MVNILGDVWSNVLIAGVDSDDFLFGFRGNDYLSDFQSEIGDNYMFGGAGHDAIESMSGRDHLFGGNGRDNFYVSGNDDRWISGGKGHDTLYLDSRHIDTNLRLHIKGVEEIVYFDFANPETLL